MALSVSNGAANLYFNSEAILPGGAAAGDLFRALIVRYQFENSDWLFTGWGWSPFSEH